MKNIFVSLYKGILAGLAIGLGGFLFILATCYIQNELGKILGSILFSIGLFTVCTFGLHLFTGRVGQVFEEKKNKDFYFSLVSMLIGNAIGAFSLGLLCYLIFKDTEMYTRANAVASLRLGFDTYQNYISCFLKSLLCGMCVYLAVKSFNLNRLKPVGIFLLIFFVFVFVYCGFEHCIANMFYFGFAKAFTIYTLVDLLLCILGNIIGTLPPVLMYKIFSNTNK